MDKIIYELLTDESKRAPEVLDTQVWQDLNVGQPWI